MSPIDPISGAPLPYPGDPGFAGPSPGTSENVGSENDIIREMIRLGQLFLQASNDDLKISRIQKIIASLSDILAKDRQLKDKAAGVRPEDRAAGQLLAGFGGAV